MSTADRLLLDHLKEEVEHFTSSVSGEAVPVVASELPQGDAEVLGALAVAPGTQIQRYP